MKSKEERLEGYSAFLDKNGVTGDEKEQYMSMFSDKIDKEMEATTDAEKQQAKAEQQQLINMGAGVAGSIAAVAGGQYLADALTAAPAAEAAAAGSGAALEAPTILGGSFVPAAAETGTETATTLLGSETLGSLLPYAPYAGGALAAGLLANYLIKKPWDKDMWKTEGNRWNKLYEQNPGWNGLMPEPVQLSGGRSVEELQAIDNANIAAGKWANPEFTTSRDESLLKPQDTWGYSAWGEQYGPEYMTNLSEQQRYDMNQAAINSGAVDEHHGTIDVDFNNEAYKKKLEEMGIADALLSPNTDLSRI